MKYPKNIWLMSVVFIVSLHNCKGRDVLGIANALYDITVECQSIDELSHYTKGAGIKKGDCQIIDSSTAQELSTMITNPLRKNAGGAASCTIIEIAGLGGEAGIVTTIADDLRGKSYDQDMEKFGVHRFNTVVEHGTTGVVYIFITPDGERTMMTFPGVCSHINPADATLDRIKEYRMLLSEGYLFYAPHSIESLKNAFDIAHNNGIKTVFTLSSSHAVTTFRAAFLELLPNIDILVGNEEEFCLFCECNTIQDVYAAIQKKVPMAVITKGPQGATIVTNDRIIHVPVTENVEKVVDTTGAGDIFLAGFLYGQTHNMSLEQSATLGNALAGRLIQQIGGRAAFDTKAVMAQCITA